jgi:hypothetical protein
MRWMGKDFMEFQQQKCWRSMCDFNKDEEEYICILKILMFHN